MLDLSNYRTQCEDIEPGETIRINHTDCEAGEDTRRRLYITRPIADPTKVIAYCHNCQQGGADGSNKYSIYRERRHASAAINLPPIDDNVVPPHNMVGYMKDWPVDAKSWAYSNHLVDMDAVQYGIQFDPSSDRVYIPRYDRVPNGKLVGYQLRRVSSLDGPKYLTAQKDDTPSFTVIEGDIAPRYAVVVEDYVSGIHIRKALHDTDVYVIYGTKIDPTVMYQLATHGYGGVTIWLDNDNDHVCEQAKAMKRTIELYNPNIKVRRIALANDPKHHSPEEIKNLLVQGEKDNG